MSAIYSYQEKDSRVYVINTIVYLSMKNLLFIFLKLTNGARVISFLTDIESVYFYISEHNIFSDN